MSTICAFVSGVMFSGAVVVCMMPVTALGAEPSSPATGYDIHVQAPHMMHDGTPGGPYHHYCKGISDKILQCLLFESTDPKAALVAVEYFVAKDLSRKLPPIQWHRYFHDHKVEIETGRVQVLDMPEDKGKGGGRSGLQDGRRDLPSMAEGAGVSRRKRELPAVPGA